MLLHQNSLPHLPVPKLEDSLARYLHAVRPLLNDEDYANTEQAVKEFANSDVAPKLQTYIEHRATTHTSWLYEWWVNTAYLEYRDPLMLCSNPAFYWPAQQFSDPDDQFRLASGLISAALDYRASIVKHELKPEVVGKGRRLCMNQYTTLFDSCRIPAIPRDKVILGDFSQPKPVEESVNVGIMYKNRFHCLKVDSKASDPQSIFDAVITLKQQSQTMAPPVGILTAWDRENWAVSHDKLEKADPSNAAALEVIRHCAIIICLDTVPLKPADANYSMSTRSLDSALHGGGSKYNTSNRWFDKTVQFIISQDGMVGFNQEHAPCEGVPVVAMSDYVATRVLNNDGEIWRHLKKQRDSNNLKPTDFKLTPELEKAIADATQVADKNIANVHTFVTVADTWGRVDAKKIGLSADGLLQIGVHATFYRLHGRVVSGYETGSTRRFLIGRTETIRPCSMESVELCKEMAKQNVDRTKAKELLLKAVAAQQESTHAALDGRGFDRHLLGFKRAAGELGIPLPKLFTDKGFQFAMRHVISTSQVSSVIDGAGMGYARWITPDGYCCCYNIYPNKIQLSIGALRSCPDTDPRRFGIVAAQTLAELFEIAKN